MVRILVVEDDEATKVSIEDVCKAFNWECQVAYGIKEAKDIMERWTPNIVYIDVMLKGECGLILVDWIRDNVRPIPKILVTTALAKADNIVKEHNPDYFLAKPFDLNTFESIILNQSS